MSKKFVSWRRVSTPRQGMTKLGLTSQSQIIAYHVNECGGTLIADFAEVYTGTKLECCKELRKAMQYCKDNDATLVIARSDRFRNVREALAIYDEMNENILFCDLPENDRFTLTMAFAFAEREALNGRIRTKRALGVIKDKFDRGEAHISRAGNVMTHFGREKGCKIDRKAVSNSINTRLENARENEKNKRLKLFFEDYEKDNGYIGANANYDKIANKLNALGYTTSTGMEFTVPRLRSTLKTVKKIYGMA